VSEVREQSAEVPLTGGFTNAGLVTRVAGTVRRPWRPTSPSTHRLLEHLERVGFDGAPRFLGRDQQGREVLSYIHGSAVFPPYPDWALTDDALVSVAELMRRYHVAASSFDASGHVWPQALPTHFRGPLITHNDPNLDNVIFRDGRAVALIDFDLACPGTAVWDVACAARLWSPLREERDVPEPLRGQALDRLRLFVDAYGLPARERARVVEAMLHAHDWCYDIVRRAVENGHPTFGEIWRNGVRVRTERTRRWLAGHAPDMRAALGA
jgi:hypothetical protein